MESLYNELLELMDEGTGLIATLEGLLDEDYHSVTALRLAELGESNGRKEALESELRSVDGRWTEVVQRLAHVVGLPQADYTFEEVVADADSPWRESLLERGAQIRKQLTILREKGQANIHFLEHSLLRVGETLTFINYLLNPAVTYGAEGKVDSPDTSGVLLSSQV